MSNTSGCVSKIFHKLSLKVLTALFKIFLESTGLLSWYKKQGILKVPTGLFVE